MTDMTQTNLYGVAIGTMGTNPFVIHFDTRDPTSYDANYPIQKRWFNTVNETYWILETFTTIGGTLQADWDPIGFGVSTVTSLTGNTGGPVFPDSTHTINVIGDGIGITIAGVPGTHTLTVSLVGGGIAAQSFNVDAHTAPGTDPVVPDATGQVTITGGQVAAGTTTNVIRTDSLAANAFTIEVQRSQAVASTTIGDNGVCHFNSAQFSVDANGFVSITNFTAFNYVQINHASSPYVVTATDEFISCDAAAGTITIQLPNAPTVYREFIIKDRTGHASTNHISITTVGGVVTVDTQTTYTLAGNFGSIQLLFNGTSYEVF